MALRLEVFVRAKQHDLQLGHGTAAAQKGDGGAETRRVRDPLQELLVEGLHQGNAAWQVIEEGQPYAPQARGLDSVAFVPSRSSSKMTNEEAFSAGRNGTSVAWPLVSAYTVQGRS